MPFIAYPVKIHIWLQIKIVEANTKKCIRNIQNKKGTLNSPFLTLSLIHLIFTALLIYKHGNSVYYHGNPYTITETPSKFP